MGLGFVLIGHQSVLSAYIASSKICESKLLSVAGKKEDFWHSTHFFPLTVANLSK